MTITAPPLDRRLQFLQCTVSHPSVSLLLPTTPAPMLTDHDGKTLRGMAGDAERRFAQEMATVNCQVLVDRLAETVNRAGRGSADHGLAVLVSVDHADILTLPFAPRRRVVVDPTFATRDLARANARWPHYRVLVVSSTRVRLLEGRYGALIDLPLPDMPRSVPSPARGHAGRRPRGRPERWAVAERRSRLVSDAAEAVLHPYQGRSRLPLVVVGPPRAIKTVGRSAHRDDIVATVTGNLIDAPTYRLGALAAPKVTAWSHRSHAAALSRLEDAERAGRVRWGLSEAWHQAISGHVEQLWVSEDYAPPARMMQGGTTFVPVTDDDASTSGVVDDLVDELIEVVTLLGGVAHQVHPSVLGDRPEPIAVAVSRRRHHRSAAPQ